MALVTLVRPPPNLRTSGAKAVFSGILSDPHASAAMAKDVVARLRPACDWITGLVRAATPVADPASLGSGNPPAGTLRSSVDGRVLETPRGFVIKVEVDKALRQPSRIEQVQLEPGKRRQKSRQGKRQRRYGEVPYGIFVDNHTGFLTDTVADRYPQLLEAINTAVRAHVDSLNAGRGDSPREEYRRG